MKKALDNLRCNVKVTIVHLGGEKNGITKLQELRKSRNLSRVELSRISGVAPSTIRDYEYQKLDISKAQINNLLKLSKALNCKIEDLLDLNIEEEKKEQ